MDNQGADVSLKVNLLATLVLSASLIPFAM